MQAAAAEVEVYMSKIPDEILRHRLPGTEIKQVGEHYYIQRVKCVWVPEKKKRRKVVLEFIESVTAEGIVPKKTRKVPVTGPDYSLEYGASWVVREVSGDIREAQREYNPHGSKDPQINIMYAITLKDDGIAPVFYKRYPGSERVSQSGQCDGLDHSPGHCRQGIYQAGRM
jgi:hypothetical protein